MTQLLLLCSMLKRSYSDYDTHNGNKLLHICCISEAKNCGIFRAVVHENWAHTIVCTEYLSILSLYVQEQEIESLAAIESELENVAQKLHELRRG